jgi:hypothetical protein
MPNDISFNEENSKDTRSIYYASTTNTLASLLVRHGIAKNVNQANYFLIYFAIALIILSIALCFILRPQPPKVYPEPKGIEPTLQSQSTHNS